jgi:predicted acyltransferase
MSREIVSPDPKTKRLMSLDALRGFDMFWIVGGESVIVALLALTGWKGFQVILDQLEHPEWNGFLFLDLVFPLFIFISGVAMPYSLGRRLEQQHSLAQLHWHVIRRGLVLVLLGLVYQGLLRFDFASLRYPSVLGRIGLAYMFAGLIFLHTGWRGQLSWVIGLWLGYWAALKWIPVPGVEVGDLTAGNTVADFIDRNLLPGQLYKVVRDPEGILSTLPAIGTALLGVLAGQWIRFGRATGHLKALLMLITGIALVIVGWVWNSWLPVNKNLWTGSFACVVGGWSLILLAAFYWIIDILEWRRWAFPFVVIGMNAITIYLAVRFVSFQDLAELIFARAKPGVDPALFDCAGFFLAWLMLYVMYRSKWFLRV